MEFSRKRTQKKRKKMSRIVSLETPIFKSRAEKEEEDQKKSPRSAGQRVRGKSRMCSKTESKREFLKKQAVCC